MIVVSFGMAVSRGICERDVGQIVSVVAVAAEASLDAEATPFSESLLDALADLVPVDHQVAYCEFERATHRAPISVERPIIPLDVDDETFDELCCFYPLRDIAVGASAEPLTLSDFASSGSLRTNPFYVEVLRPFGVVHEMKLFLPPADGTLRSFTFTRTELGDFSERDRCLLRVLRPYFAHLRSHWTPAQPTHPLTNAENRVMALVADGLTNQQIAARLVISPATVRTHLQHIFEKLDVHTRTAAAAAWRARRPPPPNHGRTGDAGTALAAFVEIEQ